MLASKNPSLGLAAPSEQRQLIVTVNSLDLGRGKNVNVLESPSLGFTGQAISTCLPVSKLAIFQPSHFVADPIQA